MQFLLKVCHQILSVTERLKSSTYGELLGIKLAVESFGPVLKHQELQFCSDSQNALKILEKGSRKEYLLAVFSACVKFDIKMQLHLVPRVENKQADFLSLFIDTDSRQILMHFFKMCSCYESQLQSIVLPVLRAQNYLDLILDFGTQEQRLLIASQLTGVMT